MKTPEQKQADKLRSNLDILHNRITSDWSFQRIKTWEDVSKYVNIDGCSGVLTYAVLKEFLQKQKDKLEEKIKNEICHNTSIEIQQGKLQISVEQVEKKEEHKIKSVDNDYGLHPCKREKDVFLYWDQKKCAKEMWDRIYVEKKPGILLIAPAGWGKTYAVSALVSRLLEADYHKNKTWGLPYFLWITRNSAVEQTKRVISTKFGVDPANECEVINIESLRSRAGRLWVKETMEIVKGEEIYDWEWKKGIAPVCILFDESHAAKNEGSTQHRITIRYTQIPNTCLISISATPFQCVKEAKYFAVSTKRDISHLGFPEGTLLSEETWPAYSAAIAAPASPDAFVEAAVERLMEDLKDYVVRAKDVKPQFKAINKVEKIYFKTKEEAKFFQDTYDKLISDMAKYKAMIDSGIAPELHPFVILMKYAMAAELCRVPHLCERAMIAHKNGFAPVLALKHKPTIIACVKSLVNDYHFPRDKMSLIWGGGQTQMNKKQIAKAQIKGKSEQLKMLGISVEDMISDVGLEDVEDRIIEELDPTLRLGMQSKIERQVEIDKFQSGKSELGIYTFKSGGVALSFHHTDELTEFKCRRKESGFVVEEDIPFVPIRPRKTILAPTYSGIDMYQGLYRVPRRTSLSDTEQTILLYGNTVEDNIYNVLSKKMRCIGAVIRKQEDFLTNIIANTDRAKEIERLLGENDVEGVENDEE